MPTPAAAPPSVIVLSCGTTAGITPCGSVAATSASYGVMPSASTAACARVDLEHVVERAARRGAGARRAARSRNRFDVSLRKAAAARAGAQLRSARGAARRGVRA